MKFSSRGTVLTTKCFFKNSSRGVPQCKEYSISPQNGVQFKAALILIFISCLIHHLFFVEYDELTNKYCVICFFACCITVVLVSLSYTIEKESLLLVVPMTLQITTTYIFGHKSSYSIPWQALGDFMIIEVIMGHQIHYFLAVVIDRGNGSKETNEHVILFRKSKPPFKSLEVLYRDLQSILDTTR